MGACPEIESDLSIDEALAILEPFYEAMREEYLARGLDRVRRTRLYVAPWMHDSPRHFAACRDDGRALVVAPELADLPYPTVIGIFAHELGHATDFLYPAEFWVDRGRRCVRLADNADLDRVTLRRRWEGRGDDEVEFTADAVAEYVTGAPIGYLGPCQLQAFAVGAARPEGLR